MGLDMYLNKKIYVQQWDFQKPEEKYQVIVTKGSKVAEEINPAQISYIIEQVGYWRKANAIHAWFVANVQDGVDDCREAYVSREKLKELLAVINRVLENHALAQELLPTQSGFFFGPTKYVDYYFQDLEDTKGILTAALKDATGNFYYESSW